MSSLLINLLTEDRPKLELFPVKYNGQHKDHVLEGKLILSRLRSFMLTESHSGYIFLKHLQEDKMLGNRALG